MEINGLEIFLTVVWAVGVVAGVFLFMRARTFRAGLVLAVAVVVPVAGTFMALIATALSRSRLRRHDLTGSSDYPL